MTLDEEERLAERAAAVGERFLAGLRAVRSPEVREVRGLGLMLGMQLKSNSARYLAALADRGVLALGAGATVIRFLPPLVISEEDVETVIGHVNELHGHPQETPGRDDGQHGANDRTPASAKSNDKKDRDKEGAESCEEVQCEAHHEGSQDGRGEEGC